MSGGRQHVNTKTGTVTKRNKNKLKLIAMKFWEYFGESKKGQNKR
jgi:hypothetical protein